MAIYGEYKHLLFDMETLMRENCILVTTMMMMMENEKCVYSYHLDSNIQSIYDYYLVDNDGNARLKLQTTHYYLRMRVHGWMKIKKISGFNTFFFLPF